MKEELQKKIKELVQECKKENVSIFIAFISDKKMGNEVYHRAGDDLLQPIASGVKNIDNGIARVTIQYDDVIDMANFAYDKGIEEEKKGK